MAPDLPRSRPRILNEQEKSKVNFSIGISIAILSSRRYHSGSHRPDAFQYFAWKNAQRFIECEKCSKYRD